MKSKKGFELSINFLVTVILAIAILGLGIVLLRNFVGGATQIQESLDAETDAQLESLLDGGQPVALPLNRATIKRGDDHIFGLGVRNTGATRDFSVFVSLSTAVDTSNTDITSQVNATEWLRYDTSSFPLEKNEQRKMSLRVEPLKDSSPGTYIFKVDVSVGGTTYGSKKFWVSVP